MIVTTSLGAFREHRREWQSKRMKIGFVPTMGALHAGHTSLLTRARQECDIVVLSIYVNPTQFDRSDDFENYPTTIESDRAAAFSAGVDEILLPQYREIYPDEYRFKISESTFSRELCGQHRPGHFDGMLTIVMKLLQLVQANRAYFGEKDYQQYLLVKQMAEAFFLETEIVSCPTVREADGLAMSSRNLRLSAQARVKAAEFSRVLNKAATAEQARAALESKGFKVDYVEDREQRRFGAVHLESVRLIDNVARK